MQRFCSPARVGCLLAMLLIVPGATTAILAQTDEAPKELGFLIGASVADRDLVGPEQDDDPAPVLGVRYGQLFGERWGLFADATYAVHDGDTALGDVDNLATRVGVEWILSPAASWKWYVEGSGGWLHVDPDFGSSIDRGFASVGIGQRHALRGGGKFRWLVRADATLSDSGLGGRDVVNYQALVGWLGGLGRPADSDGDGVPDRRDRCPDTPRGATVDEHGCPKDSDGDGVLDGIDRCPDTPRGATVDAKGCPLDSDGDGVFDGIDRCPDTPRGATVDASGCPRDSDGDGVFDGIDRCPDTPRGAKVDANGCPLDSDGDGVFDGIDRCPDTPRGTEVDATGCPRPEPARAAPLFPDERRSLVLEGVNFAYDKAELTTESHAVLDQVAASLRDWPEVRVEIGGHTDSRGSDAYNQRLSQARAEAVRAYLQSKGVADSRMNARGYGEGKPIASNETEAGRAQNRRVELTRIGG